MKLDEDALRRHYASLSDEALLALDRGDLVEAAQKCFDNELAERGLTAFPEENSLDLDPLDTLNSADELPDLEAPTDGEGEAEPAWLEHASCVCAFEVHPGGSAGARASDARRVIREAGIPCRITVKKTEEPEGRATFEYCVMVPGELSLHAASVLDKEIFNAELEADWRVHLERLSDEQLRSLSADVICAGLIDRVERLKRVFLKEVARRDSGREAAG
jgi:hypothetical protein